MIYTENNEMTEREEELEEMVRVYVKDIFRGKPQEDRECEEIYQNQIDSRSHRGKLIKNIKNEKGE